MFKGIVLGIVAFFVVGCGSEDAGESRTGDHDATGGNTGTGTGGIGGAFVGNAGQGGEPPAGGSGGTMSSGGAGGTPSGVSAMFVADDEGYVVMEMESVSIPSGSEWVTQTELPDYTGSGYYRFVGNSICNGPAGSPLRYEIEIRESARYELRLRAAKIAHCVVGAPQGNGSCTEHDRTCTSLGEPSGGSCGDPNQCIRTDISNDAFVHFEDAAGDYVAFVNQPNGSIGDPIKLFGGSVNSWGWTGKRALDINGKWDAHWDLAPGVYTLVIQGRSQAFRIDRMLLFDSETGSTSGAVDRAETRP
jgi:hypothetical protein